MHTIAACNGFYSEAVFLFILSFRSSSLMMLIIFTANAYIAQFGINKMEPVKRTTGSSQSIGYVGENQIFGFAKTIGNPYVVNSPKQASSLGGAHSKPTRNVHCILITLITSVRRKLINTTLFVLIITARHSLSKFLIIFIIRNLQCAFFALCFFQLQSKKSFTL